MGYFFSFSIALLASSLLPILPSYFLIVVLLTFAIFCIYWRYFYIVSLLLGLSLGCIQGWYLVSQQLPQDLEGEAIQVVGTIKGLPEKHQHYSRFLLAIDEVISPKPIVFNQTVKLSWYNKYSKSTPLPDLQPGQRWQLTLKLKRPRGFVNPSGFDYHAYLLRKNIYATGYVVKPQTAKWVERECRHVWVDCMRWHLQQKILALSANDHSIGPIMALAIGNSQYLTPAQWRLLKNTGTIHLLAISGLHIGLAATMGFLLGRIMVSLLSVVAGQLSLALSTYYYRFIPALCSIFLATLYSLLAGMSLPTQRALVMVLVFYVGRFFYYKISPLTTLSIALAIIALLDPLAMYSQGFWLSFLAVCVLLYGFCGRDAGRDNRIYRYLFSLGKAQWIIFIGLLLPNIMWLQGVSVSAPLANMFAVFLVSIVIVPLLFLLLITVNFLAFDTLTDLYQLIAWVMDNLLFFLQYLERISLPFQFVSNGVPWVSMVCAFFGVIWLLAPKGITYRYLGFLCFLPLLFVSQQAPSLRMTFLDVGQGTSVVLETASKRLVYDVGAKFSERFNTGEHIVAPYLRSLHSPVVNTLIVSHADADHAGGMPGLLSSVAVERILSGQASRLDTGNIKAEQCQAGQQWQWDGVSFTVLWPDINHLLVGSRSLKRNNQSCVLLIEYAEHKILLAGDIEKQVEYHLISQLQGPIDIMLVPHHGSKTSSTRAWIKTLNPRWSVVTAGHRNRYGHPHPTVLKRYLEQGSEVLNTADSGAIRWTLDKRGWQLERWRKDYQRYWYD